MDAMIEFLRKLVSWTENGSAAVFPVEHHGHRIVAGPMSRAPHKVHARINSGYLAVFNVADEVAR